MILDSFRPEALSALRAQITVELARVKREIARGEQLLRGELSPGERKRIQRVQARRQRQVKLLQARLEIVQGARYNDEPHAVRNRILDLV